MKKLLLPTAITSILLSSNSLQASDLEIFAPSTADRGNVVLTLMLDRSGSMGWPVEGSLNDLTAKCAASGGRQARFIPDVATKRTLPDGSTMDVKLKYFKCYRGNYQTYGEKMPTRLADMKSALFDLLEDENLLKNDVPGQANYYLGLGVYSGSDNTAHEGRILVPVAKLDKKHRSRLMREINAIYSAGGTPMAAAYAEAGNYMFGVDGRLQENNTTVMRKLGWYNKSEKKLYKCQSIDEGNAINAYGALWKSCISGKDFVIKENVPESKANELAESELGCKAESGATSVATTKRCLIQGSGAKINYYGKTTVQDVSGFNFSTPSTNDGTKYIKPIEAKGQCGGGAGIYLLTDGVPNVDRQGWRMRSAKLMNKGYPNSVTLYHKDTNIEDCDAPSSQYTKAFDTAGNPIFGTAKLNRLNEHSGWSCMGQYAKKLRENSNPRGESILTAVAGFGPEYAEIDVAAHQKKSVVGYEDNGDPKITEVFDCSALSGDAKNLCMLGSRDYNYGKGGIYFIKSKKNLVDSIVAFADLTKDSKSIKPISTGSMSIPANPIDSSTPRKYAYLPMLMPAIGNSTLWKGNMKKYDIKGGTIKGANNNVVTSNGEFTDNTYDLWNAAKTSDKGNVLEGGVFSNQFRFGSATGATSADNTRPDRHLFVENSAASAGSSAPTVCNTGLQPLKIAKESNRSGKPQNFNCLGSFYTPAYKSYLVNFLGYGANDKTTIQDGQLLADSAGNELKFQETYKTHGAALHSLPRVLTANATIENGKVTSQKDYVLYGSFDGALRVVDDETGFEVFTFVPKAMLKDQGSYLIPDSSTAYAKERYGIDAPWSLYIDYATDVSASSNGGSKLDLKAKSIIAAGGLRMGGSHYYALNLTDLSKPELLYSIGSEYGAEGKTAGTGDYARMGQTWGKPSIGYVKTGETTTTNGKKVPQKTMVHFLPGGYDITYESGTDVTGTSTAPNQGNAVYMVKVGELKDDTTGGKKNRKIDTSDAGKRMWWASSSATTSTSGSKLATKVPDMTNSIVSQIVPLDRDYDGLTDHIYYSDLGGRVFRADIDNSGTEYKVTRVVKMLDVSDQKSAKYDAAATDNDVSPPRFYESPLVTFMRWKGEGVSKHKIVGVISVASGNRSKPLDKRKASDNPDRVYTFVDEDLARNDGLFTPSVSLHTEELEFSDLEKLEFDASGAEKGDVEEAMTRASGKKQGWYYDLKYWNAGTTEVNGLKVLSKLHAVKKVLYFTTFNPNLDTADPNKPCQSSIKGETQRDTLCLPYGACHLQEGGPEKYAPTSAGIGIIENNFGNMGLEPVYEGEENDRKCVKNCDPTLVGIVQNIDTECQDPHDKDGNVNPTYNPINACISTGKQLFPLSWKERW